MKYTLILLSILILSSCRSNSNEKKQDTSDAGQYLFVGTYTKKEGHVDGKGKGIHIMKWNEGSQWLGPHMIIRGPVNPSYIAMHPDLPVVYAVNEIADSEPTNVGLIQAYRYDLVGKSYGKISEVTAMGDAPCHLSISDDGKHLIAANYVGGSITSYNIKEDGGLSEPVAVHVNDKTTPTTPRQEAGHAHMVRSIPGTNHIMVSDLGTDELLTFRLFDNGKLEKLHGLVTRQYGGPRHFDFHPNKDIVYALNELQPSITVVQIEEGLPKEIIQQLDIPIKKEGDPVYSSAIKAHANGKTIYAATRGLEGTAQNDIVVCQINDDGQLSIIQTISTEGLVPRDFILSPSGEYLIAGNQDSHEISVYKIDSKDGTLTLTRSNQKIPTPVCFAWKK